MSNGAENKTGIAKPADGGFRDTVEGSEPSTAGDAGKMQSQTIGKLAAALAKAQGEIKAPTKGKTAKIKSDKASYDYSYADLADVIESYRPVLSKNEIALVQPIIQRDGHLVLVTRLIHSSGEWIASEYPLTMYQKPQEQGSALTYARRYAVSALLGIAAEDDDDGKRAQDAEPYKRHKDVPAEEDAPVPADAAAIIDNAQEISQHTGKDWLAVIRDHSVFSKDGADLWFEDPTQQGYHQQGDKVRRTNPPTTKWKASVLRKLEDTLRELVVKLTPVQDSEVPF